MCVQITWSLVSKAVGWRPITPYASRALSWTWCCEAGEEEHSIEHGRQGLRQLGPAQPPWASLPPRERNSRIGPRPLLTWLGKSLVFSRGRDHADPASRPNAGPHRDSGLSTRQQASSQRPLCCQSIRHSSSPSLYKPHQVIIWFRTPHSMPSFRPLPSANYGCRLSGATLSPTPTSP